MLYITLSILLLAYSIFMFGILVTAIAITAMFLLLAIHEIGHILGGIASGMRFGFLKIGIFLWHKANGKVKFEISSYLLVNPILDMFSGQANTYPKNLYNNKPSILLILGGPLATLLCCIISTILFLIIVPTSEMTLFIMSPLWPLNFILFTFMLFSAIIFILTMLPIKISNLAFDGHYIFNGIINKKYRNDINLYLYILGHIADGINFKDIPINWDDTSFATSKNHKDPLISELLMLKVYYLIEIEKYDESLIILENLSKVNSFAKIELLYHNLVYKLDKNKARKIYIQKDVQTHLKKTSAKNLRVLSAYYNLILEHKETSIKMLDKAKILVNKMAPWDRNIEYTLILKQHQKQLE